MKTLIFLTFVFAFLTSCKKDYTCSCGSCYNIDGTPIEIKLHNTKAKAKQTCDTIVNPYKSYGDAPNCFIE